MSDLAVPIRQTLAEQIWRPIARRELYFWLAASLFANHAIQVLGFRTPAGFEYNLTGQNYIFWFACFVVLKQIGESADRPVAPSDIYLAVGLLLALLVASLIPHRFMIGLMTTLMGVRLLTFGRDDPHLKAAGTVMLALSAHLIWAPLVFQCLTPELLSADAVLVGGLLKLVRPDIVWAGTTFRTPADFTISLVGACSSFQNLSTALLACAAATMFSRTDWRKSDLVRLAIAGAAMIAMNDIRICLLAWGPDSYVFWHDGAGAQLISFSMTIVLMAIAFSGLPGRNAAR